MWTRRRFIKTSFWALLTSLAFNPLSVAWARARQLLPKGFPKKQLLSMNPAEVDSRNLDIDPLNQFGTMGQTDVAIDVKSYRLKVNGKVGRPLSLSYDQILRYPSVTEAVLLICPGFFSNNGRWTGVQVKDLLREAQIKKEAHYVNVNGAGNSTRIPLYTIQEKKVFLAYHVNGVTLPRKHGFPLRLVYEDEYGSNWVKYVDEVVVS
jgi:DMSO/TMAO reductase YedYZ molybdopterin-dependent catalytic subunit